MGAGGRRFKSSRPDHLKQWVTVQAAAHFLFGMASGVANESHTLKTGTERFFFALLRETILNKELDIFKAEEKSIAHS